MGSIVRFEFSGQPIATTAIEISNSLTTENLQAEFRASTTLGYVAIGSTVFQTMFNLANHLDIYYNNTNLYKFTFDYDNEYVYLESEVDNAVFTVVSNNSNITITIINDAIVTPFTLDSLTISEADSSPCDNVKINVTTNEQADNINTPISQPIASNPYSFDTARRGGLIKMQLEKDGTLINHSFLVPKLLSAYFKINDFSTPSSGIISVEKISPLTLTTLLEIEYSINNTDWQSSGYFNNLSEGDYTLYIRDNIGCSVSMPFTITAFNPNLIDYKPLCFVSNLNSIRYKEDVVWSDTILKTPYNTLSFEENVRVKNQSFTQLWTKSDIITTQIKTNYTNITATLIDNNDNETALVVTKKTQNMNVTDLRDAEVLSVSYNNMSYVGVKFSGGNTYDDITQAVNGDYNLGETIPEWLNVGDWINIKTIGWYKIEDIIYNDDAYTVILNLLFQDFGALAGVFVITSVYNLVDWEIYEFDVNFNITDGYYKIKIEITDDNFGSKSYLSEWQNVKDSHNNTFLIEAYNTDNNEIIYATGIQLKLRIPYLEHLKWKINNEQDIYVSNTNTIALENKYRPFWDFSVKPLPFAMAEKLTLMLLQDRLFIDTVNYTTEGEPNSNPIGGQYQVTANLVKGDYIYDSNSGLNINPNITDAEFLSISVEGGYLRVD